MEEFGVEVKNHMSVIEDEDATLIKELLGVKYQPRDIHNNAADDASNPVSQPKQP